MTRLIHSNCIGFIGCPRPMAMPASMTSISVRLVETMKWIILRMLL